MPFFQKFPLRRYPGILIILFCEIRDEICHFGHQTHVYCGGAVVATLFMCGHGMNVRQARQCVFLVILVIGAAKFKIEGSRQPSRDAPFHQKHPILFRARHVGMPIRPDMHFK